MSFKLIDAVLTFSYNYGPSPWHRGSGLQLRIGRSGFYSRHTLIACEPSDGKEVQNVIGRPGVPVLVGIMSFGNWITVQSQYTCS